MRIHTLDLDFSGIHDAIAAFIVESNHGRILIECGPASTLSVLDAQLEKKGLKRADFQHIFLSHIHFDHAGAAWAFAEAGAKIYVHPKGLPHLASPEKLYNSARMIYGDAMDRLWGPMHPIPEAQLYAPEHGEVIEVAGLTCTAWYTPGHAVHHIAWQVEMPGFDSVLFTGDVAGVCIQGGPVMPPCPPPDIHIEDWLDSIKLLHALPAKRLYLTHFGLISDKEQHLDALLSELVLWAEWMRPFAEQQIHTEVVMPKFLDFMEERYQFYGLEAAVKDRYNTANPAFMSVAGLMRYWTKRLKQLGCILLLVLSCCIGSTPVFAQNKKELEEKRQKILRDIETTNRMLKKTTASKETIYDQFITLRSQIKSRETLISTLDEEVKSADETIEQNKSIIATLQNDVDRLREDYGRMLRSAYRRRTTGHPLLFLFSAQNLNQVVARWLFLRNFDRFRQQQGAMLTSTQESLRQKISEIRQVRDDKAMLLNSMQGQKDTLRSELSDQNQMLSTLSKDEARLKNDLIKKQAAYEVLNQGIEKIIREEVKKRAEATPKTTIKRDNAVSVNKASEAESIASDKNKTTEIIKKTTQKQTTGKPDIALKPAEPEKHRQPEIVETPEIVPNAAEEDMPSADFRRQRGQLPWPVQSGFVSRGFGRQKHPTLKNIEITNNGIDIRTDENAEVKAVDAGRVAGVQFIPGHNYTVVIQHGDYYTVYSNLADAEVEKGNEVRAKQLLGHVSPNNITGMTELHFEVWREKERLNPSSWIKK